MKAEIDSCKKLISIDDCNMPDGDHNEKSCEERVRKKKCKNKINKMKCKDKIFAKKIKKTINVLESLDSYLKENEEIENAASRVDKLK